MFNVFSFLGVVLEVSGRRLAIMVLLTSLDMVTCRLRSDYLTALCDCGHALETTEHFLLHCNRYEKERKDMFDFIYQSGITTKQNKKTP